MYTADTLSRAPITHARVLNELQEEVESFAEEAVSSLPPSERLIGCILQGTGQGSYLLQGDQVLPLWLAQETLNPQLYTTILECPERGYGVE